MIWYDMVMWDELIQRHAYNNSSNTSPLTPRQGKARQDKTRQDKARSYIHRLVAYNDNDNNNDSNNDDHYSMNSHGMKIIS